MALADVEKPSHITVTNKATTNILVKFIPTNPHQYHTSLPYSLLRPFETFTLEVRLALGNIDSFHYKDNSLLLIYSKPPDTYDSIDKNFEIGKKRDRIGVVRIPIQILIDIPSLSQDT